MKPLQTIEKDISPVIFEALKIKIKTDEDMVSASSLREQIKNTIKIVKAVKQDEYRPIKNELDIVAGKYLPVEKALKAGDDAVTKAMGIYETARRKEIAEAEAKISARIGEGKWNRNYR